MRRRALTKSIATILSLRDAIQSAGDTAQISTRTGGHPMSNRNKNAGREPAPTRPARRPSITSPTELAVHLGRELSASAVDGNGWTDLHYAAALDWLAMARALLAAGARLDARLRADRGPLGPALVSTLSGCGQDWFRLLRRNGATPLHIAAVANASEVVGVLLEGGADPDVADATSATPLHYAAAGHSGPAAAVLAARGADVSAATAKGVTPLHAAARRDAVPVVRVLLEHGADVGAQDIGGDTPLHRAASGDAASSAALLLDRGADTAARANDGVPPLHVAALKNAGRVAQVLLDHGADVGARVNDGVTPLHVAALKDAAGIVAALLSHRADLGAEDAAGQAPLHWAAMGDAAAAAAVLIDHGAHVHARAERWVHTVARGGVQQRRRGGAGAAGARRGHPCEGRREADASALGGGGRWRVGGGSPAGLRGGHRRAVGGRLHAVARGGPAAGLAVGVGIAGPRRRPPGHGPRRRHSGYRVGDGALRSATRRAEWSWRPHGQRRPHRPATMNGCAPAARSEPRRGPYRSPSSKG